MINIELKEEGGIINVSYLLWHFYNLNVITGRR